jgi:hypothetical protein
VASPDQRSAKIVFDEIRRIEGLLSKYKADSEISKLNRLGRLKVSPETFYIIKKAKEFWQLSNGAFDITVAPLMDLWGFTDKDLSMGDEDDGDVIGDPTADDNATITITFDCAEDAERVRKPLSAWLLQHAPSTARME